LLRSEKLRRTCAIHLFPLDSYFAALKRRAE
jgi:hypothetical protein